MAHYKLRGKVTNFTFNIFTFIHLADAFIQSDLQLLQHIKLNESKSNQREKYIKSR